MKKLMLIFVSLAFAVTSLFADGSSYLKFTAVGGPASVTLTKAGSPDAITLMASTNNGKSFFYYIIDYTVDLEAGTSVIFKAESTNATFSQSTSDYYYFQMTGSVEADGNIMSMLDTSMQQTSVPEYAFYRLFFQCSSLQSAPALPATTMSVHCYNDMFSGCTSLTTPPVLPATTLAESCYFRMFGQCSSLQSAPSLPVTTLADYCYNSMFVDCTSLTIAPALPATTLAPSCYSSMFKYCYSLTSAPSLPATTLAPSCYFAMFGGCLALTTAPALPATTLAEECYSYMFRECSSLLSIPRLDATVLAKECYNEMFSNCSSLKVNSSEPGKPWQIPAGAATADYWNYNMFSNTGGTFTSNPQIGVTYYVESDTTKDDTIPATAVQYVTENLELAIAPNPARISEPVYITTQDAYTIEIYDLNGKCILRTSDTSSIAAPAEPGTYIIKLTTTSGTTRTTKLIVE